MWSLLQTNSATKFICIKDSLRDERSPSSPYTVAYHHRTHSSTQWNRRCWHRLYPLRQTLRFVVLVGVFFISLRQHKTKVEIVERRYIWNLLLAVNIITVYMGNYQCVHKFSKYDVFHFNVNVCLGCLDVCIAFVHGVHMLGAADECFWFYLFGRIIKVNFWCFIWHQY